MKREMLLLLGTGMLASAMTIAGQNVQAQTPTIAGQLGGIGGTEKKTSEVEKPKDLKPGVVASYGRNARGAAVNADTGGASPGDEASAVSASVHRVKKGQCEVVLTNSSKDVGYSVSFVVDGVNSRGTRVLHQYYSASLAPGKATTKSMSCDDDVNMQVSIKSGKAKQSPSAKKADENAQAAGGAGTK